MAPLANTGFLEPLMSRVSAVDPGEPVHSGLASEILVREIKHFTNHPIHWQRAFAAHLQRTGHRVVSVLSHMAMSYQVLCKCPRLGRYPVYRR